MTPTYDESNKQARPTPRRRIRRLSIAAARIAGVIFGLAALAHISWNMFAPDMLGLEAIRMKQALGLIVFTATITFVLGAVLRFGAGGRHDVAGD